IILSLSAIIAVVLEQEVTKGIKEFAIEKAKADLTLSYKYIDIKYPGEWEIKDNQLYKGKTLMNGNDQVVDEIGEDTGDTVTIFQGDTRISTNVLKDGKRAIGTQVSEQVSNTVLKKGENFYGEA